jgi:hypothetical protein
MQADRGADDADARMLDAALELARLPLRNNCASVRRVCSGVCVFN